MTQEGRVRYRFYGGDSAIGELRGVGGDTAGMLTAALNDLARRFPGFAFDASPDAGCGAPRYRRAAPHDRAAALPRHALGYGLPRSRDPAPLPLREAGGR